LARSAMGKPMPDGWRVFSTSDQYSTCRFSRNENGSHVLTVQGEHGEGTWHLAHCDHAEQYIENGAGFPLAVFLNHPDGTTACYALACCGKQVALSDVPGITQEMFQRVGESR